jgi:hypothetical protein
MYLYLVKEDARYQYVVNTVSDISNSQSFIKITELYQVVDHEGKKCLLKLFIEKQPDTFFVKEATGEYLMNIRDMSDIIVLNNLPEYDIISREEFLKKEPQVLNEAAKY